MIKKITLTIIGLTMAMIAVSFTSCGKIDTACFDIVEGDYQAVGSYDADNDEYTDNWWHLTINKKGYSYYLSIYDNAAGNPGVKGKLVSIDESNIKIKIDQDLYEQLPSQDWKDSGKYLELTFVVNEKGITLSNNGTALDFIREGSVEYENLEFRLADRTKGYGWELTQDGVGSVTIEESTIKDSDVRYWRIYTLGPDQVGDLVLTCKYRKGDDLMYTVTFDITVMEDGRVIENDRDGDIDEAMTS